MSDQITIAGHKFKAVTNSTMRHDVFTQGQIEKCGLGRLEQFADELPEEFARRVYRTSIMSGDVFLLLGCLLMPAAEDPLTWSEAMARQTAEIMANASAPEDKAIIQAQICSALAHFFANGLSSIVISPRKSSTLEKEMEPGARNNAASTASMTETRAGAQPITAIGDC